MVPFVLFSRSPGRLAGAPSFSPAAYLIACTRRYEKFSSFAVVRHTSLVQLS